MHYKAYPFRLYPNKDQQALIHQTHGHCRFVYNHFLKLWNTAYKEEGKGLNRSTLSKMLTKLKKQDETAWLRNVDSVALQTSCEHLVDAFGHFFKKQNRYPRFKSKKNPVQSYTTKNTNHNIAIVGNKIKLPKLGRVKFKQTRALEGRIMRATIHFHASGRFSVSIMCEVPEFQPLPKTYEAIGIDLGVTDFAILSDGRKVDNQRFTAKRAKKLARLREKVAFQREDFLHKQKDYVFLRRPNLRDYGARLLKKVKPLFRARRNKQALFVGIPYFKRMRENAR